ncbi:hypothetical protein DM2_1136 [Halorubrum sp. DM2]|nr:hypothetical protein DM2_1136 [Halorubrum sp. DM2]
MMSEIVCGRRKAEVGARRFSRSPAEGEDMSDESGGSAFTEGYVVPIAGLLALMFALMAGLTAQRALSGDPADIAVTVGFAAVAVIALRIRIKAVAAKGGDATDDASEE